MVIFHSNKNKLCELQYNLYYDKSEYWNKFLEMKFNKPIKSSNKVEKLKNDINKLLNINTKL